MKTDQEKLSIGKEWKNLESPYCPVELYGQDQFPDTPLSLPVSCNSHCFRSGCLCQHYCHCDCRPKPMLTRASMELPNEQICEDVSCMFRIGRRTVVLWLYYQILVTCGVLNFLNSIPRALWRQYETRLSFIHYILWYDFVMSQ